jgi:hypothetical protein
VFAGTPITCALAALVALALPSVLAAFTTSATYLPPSEDCNVYVLEVAPVMFVQLVSPEVVQSSH